MLGASAIGFALGISAAYFSLPGNRIESPEHFAGLAAAGLAGLAAAVAMAGVARGRWTYLVALAAYAGFALLAVGATRSAEDYAVGVVLLLVAVGALLAAGYGWIASVYYRGLRRRLRVGVLVLALLVGGLSVATIVAIALPVALITLITWREAESSSAMPG